MVPTIIEIARNKAETFPLDERNPKSVKLHESVHKLRITLQRALPTLIQKLVPSSSFSKTPSAHPKLDSRLTRA